MLIYLIAAVLIPIITAVILLISLGEDFWQLITFNLGLERLLGDLFRIFLIIMGAGLLEIFVLFELIFHLL